MYFLVAIFLTISGTANPTIVHKGIHEDNANENIGEMPVEMVISLLLLLIVTTLAVVIYKKKPYQSTQAT